MWVLVVLCAAVDCPADLVGVHREATEERCRAQLRAVHDEYGYTGMCVKDISLIDPKWEEFE